MSTTNKKHCDVAIVGCGPVGAMLANFLRRSGHSVIILDRMREVFYSPRAYGLDDQTMRTMQTLGLDAELRERGHVRLVGVAFRDSDGSELVHFSNETLGEDFLSGDCGHPYTNFFHQPGFEELLREDFANEGGAEALLGYEVTEVKDRGDHTVVTAREVDTGERVQIEAAFTVGCDGPASIVRKTMGTSRKELDYTDLTGVLDPETHEVLVNRNGTFVNFGPPFYTLEFILRDAVGPEGQFHGNFGRPTSVLVDYPFITGRSTPDSYLTGEKLVEALNSGLRRFGW